MTENGWLYEFILLSPLFGHSINSDSYSDGEYKNAPSNFLFVTHRIVRYKKFPYSGADDEWAKN
ncbi:MAG: hypothetical protein AWT59_1251 [Candidatus Gallionella acididurans]|uniref:Uncharacterized protein n=1 Tax=Candidatus Gallionella acididurans TaxID=1796491 RepID=A0A139BUL4_9PROT|nr:MAG: hypothetical protein AWT59_1251 [Candidatus Gallionella acididurans]